MTRSFDPVQTRLRRVDALDLETRSRIVDALDKSMAGAFRLHVRALTLVPPASIWIRFETAYGPSLAAIEIVDRLTAAPIVQDAGEALQVADLLSRIGPVVTALETLVGARLEPVETVSDAPSGDTLVRVQAVDQETGETIVHSVLWQPPQGFSAEAVVRQSGTVPGVLGGVGIACSIAIPGPDIPPGRLSGLRPGDVLLIPVLWAHACHVAVTAPDPVGTVKPCVLVVRARTGRDGRKSGAEGASAMTDEADTALQPPDAAPDADPTLHRAWTDMAPPVSVVIDHAPLPLDQVAGLKPGSVLAFSLEGGDFPVRVMAGPSRIADGQLVSIGDGYGVLIRSTGSE